MRAPSSWPITGSVRRDHLGSHTGTVNPFRGPNLFGSMGWKLVDPGSRSNSSIGYTSVLGSGEIMPRGNIQLWCSVHYIVPNASNSLLCTMGKVAPLGSCRCSVHLFNRHCFVGSIMWKWIHWVPANSLKRHVRYCRGFLLRLAGTLMH